MGFEDDIIKGVDRGRETLSPLMLKAHEKARNTLEEYRIKEGDFAELFGAENVRRDLDRVLRKEQTFDPDSYIVKVSDIAEAIILEQGELSEWFGGDVETFKSSKFDDYFNGSDIILKRTDDDGQIRHVSLDIDVTFGTGEHTEAKIDRVIENIKTGKLSEIKYLEPSDKDSGFVPHVIVGADIETVEDLATLWVGTKKRELANHPMRYTLLEEIKVQLEVFAEYARDFGRNEAESSYREALDIIKDILKDKTDGDQDHPVATNDKVYQLINEKISSLRAYRNK